MGALTDSQSTKSNMKKTRAIRQPGYPFQGPAALRRRIHPAFLTIMITGRVNYNPFVISLSTTTINIY
jgi:hypothetical protein